MTTRNRGRSSGSGDRQTVVSSLLKQGVMWLSLAALSFLLGFFVLARVVPAQKPSTGNDNAVAVPTTPKHPIESPVPRTASAPPPAQSVAPSPTPPVRVATSPVVTSPPAGPSIDAAEDARTQAPGSLDENRSASGTTPIDAAVGGDGVRSPGSTPTTPGEAPTPRRHRRRRRKTTTESTTPASTPAPDVQTPTRMDDGTQPAGQPDAPPKEGGAQDNNGNQ